LRGFALADVERSISVSDGADLDQRALVELAQHVGDGRDRLAAGHGDRDDDLVDRVSLEELGQVGNRAGHGHPVQAHAPLRGVLVEEGDDAVVDVIVGAHLAVDQLAEVARADDDRRADLGQLVFAGAPVRPGGSGPSACVEQMDSKDRIGESRSTERGKLPCVTKRTSVPWVSAVRPTALAMLTTSPKLEKWRRPRWHAEVIRGQRVGGTP